MYFCGARDARSDVTLYVLKCAQSSKLRTVFQVLLSRQHMILR